MTREDAISALKNLRDVRLQGVEWTESLDMAIEALSADTVSREAWNDVTEEYVNTVGAILAVISAPSCLKEVNDLIELLRVVRCKDCRFAMIRTEDEMNKPIKPQPILCEWFCIGVENDDYCSHGERQET